MREDTRACSHPAFRNIPYGVTGHRSRRGGRRAVTEQLAWGDGAEELTSEEFLNKCCFARHHVRQNPEDAR
jgi:hypothetical protein